MKRPLPTYSSYVLRMWCEVNSPASVSASSEQANVRITLQNVDDGSQQHFADLHSLMAHLQQEIEAANSKGE